MPFKPFAIWHLLYATFSSWILELSHKSSPYYLPFIVWAKSHMLQHLWLLPLQEGHGHVPILTYGIWAAGSCPINSSHNYDNHYSGTSFVFLFFFIILLGNGLCYAYLIWVINIITSSLCWYSYRPHPHMQRVLPIPLIFCHCFDKNKQTQVFGYRNHWSVDSVVSQFGQPVLIF